MIAANVIRLPSAAGQKVVQERKAGRIPKTVPRMINYYSRSFTLRIQRELIAKEIESMHELIGQTERCIAWARWRVAKLKALEIGSPVADLATSRLQWERMSLEDRAKFYGNEEPFDPLA